MTALYLIERLEQINSAILVLNCNLCQLYFLLLTLIVTTCLNRLIAGHFCLYIELSCKQERYPVLYTFFNSGILSNNKGIHVLKNILCPPSKGTQHVEIFCLLNAHPVHTSKHLLFLSHCIESKCSLWRLTFFAPSLATRRLFHSLLQRES